MIDGNQARHFKTYFKTLKNVKKSFYDKSVFIIIKSYHFLNNFVILTDINNSKSYRDKAKPRINLDFATRITYRMCTEILVTGMPYFFVTFTTLLVNPKGLIELGNPNSCAEAKLYLFSFMPALEIVRRESEVLQQLVLAMYEWICYKAFL